jgi:hypothetical protein
MTHAADPADLVRALERVAATVGLEVRREKLDIGDSRLPGGLCRVDDRRLCILSDALAAEDEACALGRALLHFDLDAVYVPPVAREFLERLREAEGAEEGSHR